MRINRAIFILVVCSFFTSLQCMQLPNEIIPLVKSHLDLFSVNALLRTCLAYYEPYAEIPEHWCKEPKKIRKADIQALQFGMDRFLQDNPVFCHNLKPYEYTNTLVHYAQEKNDSMFEYVMSKESDRNKKIRLEILKCRGYSPTSITDNMKIYSGVINNSIDYIINNMVGVDCTHLFRIWILNDTFQKNQEKDGMTALHYVAQHGCVQLISLVLAHQNNIDACSVHGNTALYLASKKGHIKTCRKLLKKGANPNAKVSPLIAAIEEHDLRLVKLLITRGAHVNAQEDGIEDAPLHTATRNQNEEIIQFLLNNGADINARNNFLRTPLHCAVAANDLDTVKLLVETSKAFLDVCDMFGKTPLYTAANSHSYVIVNYLVTQGADIYKHDSKGNTLLHCFAALGSLHMVTLLVKLSGNNVAYLNAQNHAGKTPLDLGFNHYDVCGYLQSQGAEGQYSTCVIS